MGVKAEAEQPLQSAGPTLLLVNKIGFVCFYDSTVMCVCVCVCVCVSVWEESEGLAVKKN